MKEFTISLVVLEGRGTSPSQAGNKTPKTWILTSGTQSRYNEHSLCSWWGPFCAHSRPFSCQPRGKTRDTLAEDLDPLSKRFRSSPPSLSSTPVAVAQTR